MAEKSKEQYFLERLNDGMGFWVKSKARFAYAKSPFQDIEVLETDFGRTLRIDEYFMTSDKDEFFYHENMIHQCWDCDSQGELYDYGDGEFSEFEEEYGEGVSIH